VPLSLLVISVELVVDYVLIGITIWLEPRRVSLRGAFGHLRLGVLPDFLLVYLASASLGAMLVALYHVAGLLALPMVLPPVLLSRQALMRSKMFAETDQAYRHREVAFAELARQMDRERRDERRLIAADLHDELLPALFRVTLLGQVVRTELETGRLLELEADMSVLTASVDAAADVGRQIIGDLRRSTLGAGGLSRALTRLCQVVQGHTTIEVTSSVEAVRASEERELALYQIAKEALGNAVQHSRARSIRVGLHQEQGHLVLEVVDDGVGFDPFVEREDHYGLVVMRERAVAVGASLYVDASAGHGCAIRVSVPTDP
jgi:signal transduction histidine kinase